MKKFFKISLITGLIIFIILIIGIIIVLTNISNSVSLHDLDKSKLTTSYSNIEIYDTNDNIISKNTQYIPIANLNDYTKNAFIAIEDKDFYNHNGLNYKRIAAALLSNLKSGSFKEGASTISQQLVKNTQLTNDKTIERKLKEIYITQALENEYSKDEILEMYLNNIYYGNSAYGIEPASLSYFGKHASELSISESAVLAGLIKSPGIYSPICNMEKCKQRRNLVLSEMLEDNYISSDEYNKALSEEIVLNPKNLENDNSKIFYDYLDFALQEASNILNMSIDEIKANEYKIYTYLDKDAQNQVFNIINKEEYLVKNNNGLVCQGLVTVIDNKDNTLISFASNTDYKVTNLLRQPGSAIKPIMVYAPALEKGLITPLTKIVDEPIDIDGYKPKNVGNVYHGAVSVREAVAYSLNIPSVKILQDVGIDYAKEIANKVNIDFSQKDNGYALALGGFTNGVTLENLTNSYTVFANLGQFKPVSAIKKITNKYGMPIYIDNRESTKVISDDTAYLMTSILKDGVNYGTSKRLNSLNYEIAGKTGTVAVPNTNYNTDAISIAYTTDYTVGCWLGNYTLDQKANLEGSNNGGTYATSILKDTFDFLSKDNCPKDFKIPDSVTKCKINRIEYERDNIINLSNDSFDERYIIEDYFSNKNLPTLSNTTYHLNYEIVYNEDKNCVQINLQTSPTYIYQIIKINGDNEKTIKTIENNDNNFTFIDNDVNYNKTYKYYIKYKSKEKNNYQITSKHEIVTKKINEEKSYILDDYGWLFN